MARHARISNTRTSALSDDSVVWKPDRAVTRRYDKSSPVASSRVTSWKMFPTIQRATPLRASKRHVADGQMGITINSRTMRRVLARARVCVCVFGALLVSCVQGVSISFGEIDSSSRWRTPTGVYRDPCGLRASKKNER